MRIKSEKLLEILASNSLTIIRTEDFGTFSIHFVVGDDGVEYIAIASSGDDGALINCPIVERDA